MNVSMKLVAATLMALLFMVSLTVIAPARSPSTKTVSIQGYQYPTIRYMSGSYSELIALVDGSNRGGVWMTFHIYLTATDANNLVLVLSYISDLSIFVALASVFLGQVATLLISVAIALTADTWQHILSVSKNFDGSIDLYIDALSYLEGLYRVGAFLMKAGTHWWIVFSFGMGAFEVSLGSNIHERKGWRALLCQIDSCSQSVS